MPKPLASFYAIPEDMQDYLTAQLTDFEVILHDDPLNEKNSDPKTVALGGFVDSKITGEVIEKLPNLKVIVTLSTGYNHIDLDAARERNIPACNVPAYGEATVAEYALTLILALTRKLFPAVKQVKEGQYEFGGIRGTDLAGKTIGIIGTGRIGMHLVEMLQGFDMRVLAYDVHPKKELEDDHEFTYVELDELLAQSDIISLHVPLFPNTKHMINKESIAKMKKGSYIVNTARGALIEPEALLKALDSEHLAGAGIDVLEDEEALEHPECLFNESCDPNLIKTSLINNMLIDHPKTIVTPHNAFHTTEALQRIIDTSAENIHAALAGNPQNDVTQKAKK